MAFANAPGDRLRELYCAAARQLQLSFLRHGDCVALGSHQPRLFSPLGLAVRLRATCLALSNHRIGDGV